jgi:hypothetical protein
MTHAIFIVLVNFARSLPTRPWRVFTMRLPHHSAITRRIGDVCVEDVNGKPQVA